MLLVGKCTGKVDHVLFMDDLKLYSQNRKQIDALVNTVQILGKDSGMEFGISKFATLTMKRGVISRSKDVQLPNDEVKN